MRTLAQIYHTNNLIELGSYQYESISQSHSLYCEDRKELPDFYKKIIDEFQEEFKGELFKFLEKEFKVYEAVRLKKMKDLTQDEREEFFFDVYQEQKAFARMKDFLSPEPFKFPVKPHLQKIALLEFVEFKKQKAWDLWSLCIYLQRELFRKMMPFIGESAEVSRSNDAAIIYIFKVIFDLDHTTITKYFGGFDT
jgi:hypothetical protein